MDEVEKEKEERCIFSSILYNNEECINENILKQAELEVPIQDDSAACGVFIIK